ncbi:MAG: hypothetical protein JRE72_13440 [Deltaproteobacteria bacterium]|jgi:hypothetical protein|nr:hypothetical protein [Deltaproteobacteria bacterium]
MMKFALMNEIEDLTRQVLHNCDISDAQHAGLYSTCGLALRLRDLYKWEHRLNPWEEKDTSEILDWIGEKEALWEKLADAKQTDIAIQGNVYDLYDTSAINAILEPRGLFYGAGYAFSLKPSFFLAEIEDKRHNNGYAVYSLGRELARDLLTLPALTQDRQILLRTDSARMYLWDQMVYIKKSGRPALRYALEHCGLKKLDAGEMQQHLPAILAAQKDNYIYHEIGELSDATFDPKIWRELIAVFPHSPVELLARALKDLLADTHPSGTLHHLIANRKFAGLGFYAAFLDGMLKELFPQLREAFIDFTKTGNWRIIKTVTLEGHQHAKKVAAEMIDLYQTGKNRNQLQWTKEQIERRLLKQR